MSKSMIACMIASVLTVLSLHTTAAVPDTPPNIVIIFLDDMGYGDLTITGAKGYKTPNIDKLAQEGVYCTQSYAAQPICTASRAGLLTGCYPNRIGFQGALGPSSKIGISSQEMTIAEILKQKNYATGIFGKWHLGSLQQFLPLQHGFDEYMGLPFSNDMRRNGLPLIEGNNKIGDFSSLEDQAKLTTLYTDRAVSFIKKNQKKPFFLYLPHSMPHVPLAVSTKFKGKSKLGLFGDVMMEIDWSVGQIMATLKALNLEKNTLVIFASDNGPWLNYGDHAGSAGGLREGKGTIWEGGIRVPSIMRWTGKIKEGQICNQLISTIDFLPTIASICGVNLPPNKIDGVNIWPLISGATDISPRKNFLYYYDANSLKAIRNDRWKLVFPHTTRTYEEDIPGKGGIAGKTSQRTVPEIQLFDLRRDPGERYDVKSLFPEVVDELTKTAALARADLGDDLTSQKGSGRRPIGKENQ